MWLKPWSTVGVFIPSLNGLLFTHKLPLDLTNFSGVPSDAVASALAEPGKQYAIYLFHGANDEKWGAHFVTKSGTYRDAITLKAIPAGTYGLEWIDPATGIVKSTESLSWAGGDLTVTTPEYSMDVALRMRARP